MVTAVKHELTESGKRDLEKEIKFLREVKREENIKALQEARAQGDLSENADYDSAKEEQAKINARITEIENILKNFVIIKKDSSGLISTGSMVELLFEGESKAEKFQIIGTLQADPLNGKISNKSPLGKSLLGKKNGDVVTYKSETGQPFTISIKGVK
jgi:transcription elongation factor GreA